MKRYSIYCGLESRSAAIMNGEYVLVEDGRRISTRAMVHELAATHFPSGYTIYEAEGRWNDPRRPDRACTERTLIVEVWEESENLLLSQEPPVRAFVRAYKSRGKQDEVVALVQEIDKVIR